MIRKSTSAALVAAIAAVLVGSAPYAQSTVGLDRSQARVYSAAAGLPLAAASKASPQSVVNGYLQANGRGQDVLASLRMTSSSVTPYGMTHLRMAQQIDGLSVYGAYAKAAVNAKGELVQVIDHLAAVGLVQPNRIDAAQAVAVALAKLYPSQPANLRVAAVKGNTTEFAGGAFFSRGPSATAVVLPLDNGTLARGWVVETWTMKDNQLHYTVVDGNGQVLDVESRTNTDSYNVFVEDPGKGAQAIVNGPGASNAQSPSGWLGTGSQTTINIQGNNVKSYLDTDANNAPDSGGTTVSDGKFESSVDLGMAPSTTTNKAVATQNLFYLNNIVHDTLYRHGFVEGEGNFQTNNFGKGGLGNDPVNAEAQDGSGTDNANFSTPSDGSSPRMQMYLWTGPAGATHEVLALSTNYDAMGADFGPKLSTSGLSGVLAIANDGTGTTSDACEAITTSLSGKIAIVDRGTCNFTVKVLNAQTAGAIGVVVVNNAAGSPFTMAGTDRKVKIPSVMVSQTDGATLKGLPAGTPGTERLKLVQPTAALQLDGDLDADIVFHEYGHGLTWRMIGGMSGVFAGAIGEGASDVVAFLINGDDRVGEYSYSNPIGIRRYPYASHPLTYKDWTAGEVHADGEIYAAAMWKVLEQYVANGLTADQLMDDFVRGMPYTPATPTPELMRDGMLTWIQNRPDSDATNAKRRCAIWTGFVAKKIGFGAKGTVSRRGTVTITESDQYPAGACTP